MKTRNPNSGGIIHAIKKVIVSIIAFYTLVALLLWLPFYKAK
jgi:membrane protein involved in colicin uptake